MEKRAARSKAACQFCRTRKLKCDNLQPICGACKARDIHCEYVTRTPAPRPSNAAIQALQAENKRLRRLLDATASNSNIDENGREESHEGEEVQLGSRSSTATQQPAPNTTETQTYDLQYQSSPNHSPERPGVDAFDSNFQENVSPSTQFQQHAEPEPAQKTTSTHTGWNGLLRGIDEFGSPLDSTTRDVLRSQLVAAAARQRLFA
jgi:hypothetical protein